MERICNIFQLKYQPLNESAEALSRAFFDDPLFSYIINDESDRKKLLPYLFKAFILYCTKYGEVYATSQNLEGLALWVPSDVCFITPERAEKCRIGIFFFRLGVKYLERLSITEITNNIHEELIDEPHFYLMLLGVEPKYQRKGFGGNLLIPMLKKLDGKGLKCFLDTNKPENVLFYQRYGFKVIKKYEIADTGIVNWSMLRNPEKKKNNI